MWPLMAKLATEAKDNPDIFNLLGVQAQKTLLGSLLGCFYH